MEQGIKTGFVAGTLVGLAAGILLSPRRRAARDGQDEGEGVARPAVADDADLPHAQSEALKRKIEETRRRLREQVGPPPAQ